MKFVNFEFLRIRRAVLADLAGERRYPPRWPRGGKAPKSRGVEEWAFDGEVISRVKG